MKNQLQWVAGFLLLGLALPLSAADIKEGRWQYSSEMQFGGSMKMPDQAAMPKMPEGMKLPEGMSMPQFSAKGMTHSFQRCVTQNDLVPQDENDPQDCKIKKMDRSGNTIQWAMHCSGPEGEFDGEGTATYQSDRMSSQMKLKGSHEGQPIEMTQKTTGRYLGPCK